MMAKRHRRLKVEMLRKRPNIKSRRLGSYLLLVFLIYLLVEGLFYVSLFVLEEVSNFPSNPVVSTLSEELKTSLSNFLEQQKGEHTAQHPVLGWVNLSQTNSAGMRDNQEYEAVPSPGMLRFSAFGDSFTFGSDVALNDAWAKQLTMIPPPIEVLNYGVGAYMITTIRTTIAREHSTFYRLFDLLRFSGLESTKG